MAFNGDFSVTLDTSITSFTLTDTSTGSDANLTGRQVYLYKTDGTTIVPTGTATDYIVWPIVDNTIDIDALTRDYALSIVVLWVSSSPLPSPSEYTKTAVYLFSGYTSSFWYGLIQQMAANPLISSDKKFYQNLSRLITDLDNATQAVANSDQYSAQSALDRIQNMIDHQSIYF